MKETYDNLFGLASVMRFSGPCFDNQEQKCEACRTRFGESPAGVRRKKGRRAVFDLVLASFVLALTPMALDLVWRLATGIGDWIDRGFTRAADETESGGSLLPLNQILPSSCLSAAAGIPCPDAARSWGSNRRGSAQVRPSRLSRSGRDA